MAFTDYLDERLGSLPFTGRDLARPQAEKPRGKRPWSKVRHARFKNDVVKFDHLDGGMTGKQKGRLSALAAKAFKQLKVQGWTLDEWRQSEAMECCNCRISEAPAKMYKKLEAHFLALCGDIAGSSQAYAKSSDNAQRQGSLLFIIGKVLCKLPRLNAEDTEDPPKGTPRKTAWAWADEIARRIYGGACRQLDVNALGALHLRLKREVSAERGMQKLLNKDRKEAAKKAKALGIKTPRVKTPKAPKVKVEKPVMCPCKRCGTLNPVANDGTRGAAMPFIQCSSSDCNRKLEGSRFAEVLAAWNKGGQGA